jgi:PAP2 superfamily
MSQATITAERPDGREPLSKRAARPARRAAMRASSTLLGVIGIVAVLSVVGNTAAGASPAVGGSGVSPASVIAWNRIADKAAIAVAKESPMESAVTVGIVQSAVYNAVQAIIGGYEAYGQALSPQPTASVDAAVAAAAHDVLVNYFPDQKTDLDTAYTSALAAISDGDAKTSGVALGQASAAATIAARAGDGLFGASSFTMPAAAPGVWQLPPDQKPLDPWMAELRPFILSSADQFLPGPPPALDSATYATDFNETKSMGGADSTLRTPEQTLIAQFWTAPPVAQYNTAFEGVIADHGMDAMQAARLYAMGNMIGADALTACMNAKYHYLAWRPLFAVPEAADDGNDATTADPAWTPLVKTPAFPEYPSNHACLTTSEAMVLANVLGTDNIDLTVTSSVTADGMPSRHYATAADLVEDVFNARIWGGLHFRNSEVVGGLLANEVVDYALTHAFQPLP